MSDRRVRVVFEAEIAKFKQGMSELAQSTEEAAKKAEASGKATDKQVAAVKTLAPAVTVAGAGIVTGVGLAVAKFAEFDKAMSSVQAATHETTGNMGLLREAAIRAGADTAFSAAEAAQGIEELAKAGVSTESILNGGLNGALSLAAAGNLGVGESAEIAASAMTQFKLSGDQIPHLADLLAAGAGKAQGSVQDLGAALNQSGLVAASTGLTIEESTGALAAFASAGLTGSDAGTSFKTMLQSLNPNSKAAAQLMDELGIKAYDASGEFIGMSEYAGVLQGALSDMSSEQRNATLKTLFGSDAVRAANVLYEQGADGIQKWEDAVNDAGYAAETASIMQNNLAGDVEKLGGAFDTVFIQSGGAGNDMLRGFVQSAESVVDVIGKIPAPILGVGTVMAGVAGGALLLGGGLITALPKIKETKDALRDLAPAGSKAARGLDRVKGGMAGIAKAGAAAGAIMAVGVGVAKLAELSYSKDLIAGTGHIAVALQEIANVGPEAAAVLDAAFKDRNGGGITGEIDGISSAIDYLFADDPGQKFNLWGQDVVNSLTGIRGGKQIAEESFRGIDAEIANLVNSGNLEGAEAGFAAVQQKLRDAGVTAEEASHLFPQYADALARTEAASSGAAGGTDEVKSALDAVGLSANGAVESMEAFLDELFNLGNVTMDSRDAAAAYEEQIDSITEAQKEIAKGKMGKALNKTKDDFDLATEAGRLANSEFQDLARKGMDEVAKMSEEGLGQDKLQAKLSTTYKDLVKAGEGFGLSGDAAKDLAREVLGVPDGVSVKTWMDDKAKSTAEETTSAVDAIPDMKNVKIIVTEDGTVAVTDEQIQSIKDRTIATTVTDEGTILQIQGGINNVEGTVEHILVNDDGTVQIVQTKINKTTGKTEYITVTDGSTVQGVQNKIDNLRGKTVEITIQENRRISQEIVDYGQGRKAMGGRIPKKSTGGRLPYTGLGTDKILGLNSDGVPVSWVDDGEWVIRESMSSKHNALLGMINRDDPRIGQLAGLIGHKSGGRVGWSKEQDAKLRGKASDATADRKQAEKDLKGSEKSYNSISGKKEDKSAKAAAKKRRDQDKRDLDKAKKAEDKAKKALQDSKARTARLSESTFDLKTDVRRGDIREQVTSGSGLSVVDRMFDASNNPDLSKKQQKALRAAGYKAEKELLAMEKQSDKLEKSLEKARSKYEELAGIRDKVADGLRGEQSLSNAFGLVDDKAVASLEKYKSIQDDMVSKRDSIGKALAGETTLSGLISEHQATKYGRVTAGGIAALGKSKVAKLKAFAEKLEALRKKGYSTAVIDEIAGMGSEAGVQAADILLSAGTAERNQINANYKDLEKYGTQAGKVVADSMYAGGMSGMAKLVSGVNAAAGSATGKLTSKDLVKDARGMANRIMIFSAKLNQLAKRGLTGVILEEIAGLGTEEGSRVADAMLAGSDADIKSLNSAYKDIDKWSTAAGVNVTKGFYEGGVNAALGIVKGLESQETVVNKAMEKLAKSMEKTLRKAWGIQSPSRVMKGLMHHVGEGGVIGLKDMQAPMAKAMEDLVPTPDLSLGAWSMPEAARYAVPAYAPPRVTGAQVAQNLTVIVENPWTGEQMQAKVRMVASEEVSKGQMQAGTLYANQR